MGEGGAKTPAKTREEAARPRLGRGVAGLVGDSGGEPEEVVRARGQKGVPIEFVKASPLNPRVMFGGGDNIGHRRFPHAVDGARRWCRTRQLSAVSR